MISAAAPYLAVFTASLLGSLHCAGMCGPIAACATGRLGPGGGSPTPVTLTTRGRRTTSQALPSLAYHGARLSVYAALGALAGGLGRATDVAGSLAGLQRAALWLAGGTVVLLGLRTVARAAGWWRPRAGPTPVPATLAPITARLGSWPIPARAAGLGLITGLLPCGWLWAFLAASAGTGQVGSGAATMLAFWLGTIPALAASGSVLPRLAAPILRRAPYAGGVLIVVVGVVMILTRTTGMARAATPDDPDAALPRCCHAP